MKTDYPLPDYLHPYRRQYTVAKWLPAADREVMTDQVLQWFDTVLAYYSTDHWAFGVNRKGEYLPGQCSAVVPDNLIIERDQWVLRFRVLPQGRRRPHKASELADVRDHIHKSLLPVLCRLVGEHRLNKVLHDVRVRHGLPVLKRKDGVWE